MHRVIVPVDFSEASMNAARFTAQMLTSKKDATVILYHNYKHRDEHDNSFNYLENLKQEFLDKGVANVESEVELGGDLVENIARLSQTRTASLITMGMTGHSSLGNVFMGNNTLRMVEHSIAPVMIIPRDATFGDIKNVAFASDFRDVENTTPTAFISSVLEMFDPMLHIVNVNSDFYIAIPEEHRHEKERLREMFKNYKTEFYFIGMFDFHEALDNFIRDYKIDLLVTVPRYHKAVTALFNSTHTKRLAYHSHIPLLAAHQ
jgi:nucleotide-binding universal stress UspA family protein